MIDPIAQAYLEAYGAANPEAPKMGVTYSGGYYRFADTSGWPLAPVRRSKLIEMTDRLRKRVQERAA